MGCSSTNSACCGGDKPVDVGKRDASYGGSPWTACAAALCWPDGCWSRTLLSGSDLADPPWVLGDIIWVLGDFLGFYPFSTLCLPLLCSFTPTTYPTAKCPSPLVMFADTPIVFVVHCPCCVAPFCTHTISPSRCARPELTVTQITLDMSRQCPPLC
jgi:hypothetical protein